jgi:nitrogenase-associated protein
MNITFWEKPGCKGNARQKGILMASGHRLEVRNLLNEAWTIDRLQEFFAGTEVGSWFNRSSPRIKSGEILPESLSADAALALMLADPLLIRRPLMEAEGKRCAGFDPERMKGWIDIRPDLLENQQPPETCIGTAGDCAVK